MNARASGRRTTCDINDARARLRDAEAFLEIAEAARSRILST